MEYLIHGANVVYLLSYAVRDILWLRVLTVVAALVLIAYFWTLPTPLTTAIYWNLLFTAFNLYWIVRLLLERRPVQLVGNDLKLYQLVFRCLTPREMKKLIELGRWESAEAGECFVSRGQSLSRLMVICSGKARVDRGEPNHQTSDNSEVLGDGQFIGGVSFISEDVAPANVTAVQQTWYMSWPKQTLKDYLKQEPELSAALHMTLGYDLTRRLEALHTGKPYAPAAATGNL